MAIEDGIICRVQPLNGQTQVTDSVDSGVFAGVGTPTLIDEGGEKAWQLTGGALSKAIPSHIVGNQTDGSGMTRAIRYKINSLSGGNFDVITKLTDSLATNSHLLFSKNGATAVRCRMNNTQASLAITDGLVGVVTLVQTQRILSGSSDEHGIWQNQNPADPNRAPDYLSTANNNIASLDVELATLDSTANGDITFLDYVVWNRELTNAEASGVADDIRAELPAEAVTTSVTTGTAVPTQTESDIVTGGKTIILTLTGDTWAAAGTGPIGSTADTQAIIDGLDSAQSELTGWNNEVRNKELTTSVVRTSGTVATITLTASAAYDITATETITATIPAAALVTSAIDVVSSPTFTVTHVVAVPSITTEPLKNNTGQLLFSESGVIADVYDTTSGALVVRKTGLTSDVSGVVTFTDAAMSAATLYRVVITLSGDEEGIARITSV